MTKCSIKIEFQSFLFFFFSCSIHVDRRPQCRWSAVSPFIFIHPRSSFRKKFRFTTRTFFPFFFLSLSPILHPKWAHQKYYKNRITGVFVCATTMGNGRSAASTHKNWRIWMWFLDKLSPAVTHNADTDETRRKPRRERESSRLLSTPFSYATYQSIESQLYFCSLAPRRCAAGAGSFLVSGETSSPGYFNNEWLFKQYNQNPYASPKKNVWRGKSSVKERRKKNESCRTCRASSYATYSIPTNERVIIIRIIIFPPCLFFFSLSLATEKEEKSPGPENKKKKKLGKRKKKRNGSEKVFPCV